MDIRLVFQSTPFVRRETKIYNVSLWDNIFQSTPFVRRETHPFPCVLAFCFISIHSLREKGDMEEMLSTDEFDHFNPLPSWEGRHGLSKWLIIAIIFQSTPFVRRETFRLRFHSRYILYFNPLPSWEGRQLWSCQANTSTLFQSTPFVRRETRAFFSLIAVRLFQSTPFVRRETSNLYGSKVTCKISIHSLREKGDTGPEPNNPGHYISIHSLREKGDKIKLTVVRAITHFNPLPSWEGRLERILLYLILCYFNPLPSWEGRLWLKTTSQHIKGFQSTPFVRRETLVIWQCVCRNDISIHSLREKGD